MMRICLWIFFLTLFCFFYTKKYINFFLYANKDFHPQTLVPFFFPRNNILISIFLSRHILLTTKVKLACNILSSISFGRKIVLKFLHLGISLTFWPIHTFVLFTECPKHFKSDYVFFVLHVFIFRYI